MDHGEVPGGIAWLWTRIGSQWLMHAVNRHKQWHELYGRIEFQMQARRSMLRDAAPTPSTCIVQLYMPCSVYSTSPGSFIRCHFMVFHLQMLCSRILENVLTVVQVRQWDKSLGKLPNTHKALKLLILPTYRPGNYL